MDTISLYSFANMAWLGVQAVPLIIWPSSIGSLLHGQNEPTTSLEAYFARSLGFALLTIALIVVFLSGAVPLTSSDQAEGSVSPYATAVITVSVFQHATAAFTCYSRYLWTGETGFLLGCLGSSALGVCALWCVLFAGDKAMISRYHHYDQSTSGFPFKNSASYRAKKKAL